MPCNYNLQSIFSLCTDGSYYTANATQIGVVAKYFGGGISDGNNGIVAPTWDYTMFLEKQTSSGAFTVVASANGYFKSQTPTKYFTTGNLTEGRYRIRMRAQARENKNYLETVYTYSFMVYR